MISFLNILYDYVGTGKTVTGVHIAYWFAQLNQERKLVEEKEEEHTGHMVFYCGPSNKSVDVVARTYKLHNYRVPTLEENFSLFPIPPL